MKNSDWSAMTNHAWPATKQFLRTMVAINSFTTNVVGIQRMGGCVAAQFAPMDFEPQFVPHPDPIYGSHLVLKRPFVADAPTVALLAHLDTVFPESEEQANHFVWRDMGERIHGPGTNDIKGGIAMIWMLLTTMKQEFPQQFHATNWVVLCNACEETDSADFGHVCREQLPENTRACLIFEADGSDAQDFAVVTARNGRATFRVEVRGRGAHAGGQHARGANAILQLGRVIEKLESLTDYSRGVTINVGRAHGGTVLNRVPELAVAELEMRSFQPATFDLAKSSILSLGGPGDLTSRDAEAMACQIEVRQMEETPPWPHNAGSDALYAIYEKAAAEMATPIAHQQRGGLSDGNVLWNFFPTLDGLGPRGNFAHCSEHDPALGKTQEFVDVTSFPQKLELNLRALLLILAMK